MAYEIAVMAAIMAIGPLILHGFVSGVINKMIIDQNQTQRMFQMRKDQLDVRPSKKNSPPPHTISFLYAALPRPSFLTPSHTNSLAPVARAPSYAWPQDYMRENNIPMDLRMRVRSNLEYRMRTDKIETDEEVLDLMPTSVRAQVLLHIAEPILDEVPGFAALDRAGKLTVAQRLTSEVYAPGDRIIVDRQPVDTLYMIARGRVEMWVGGVAASVLETGSYFGDIGTLLGTVSSLTVIANSHVEVYRLHRLDLIEVLEAFPACCAAIYAMAQRRLAWTTEQIQMADELRTSLLIQESLQEDGVGGPGGASTDAHVVLPSRRGGADRTRASVAPGAGLAKKSVMREYPAMR